MGLDAPAVVVGCGGTTEEIGGQHARLVERSGAALRVYPQADAARLYAALRDFPAAREDGHSHACGCRISVLPSQLAPLLVRVEEEAARRHVEAVMLSHVGNGIAWIFTSATDTAVLPSLAEWLRATVRAAGGWTVFERVPATLRDRIDPWDKEPPGLQLMRGIKQTLDPGGNLSPGRFVGGI